MLRFKELWQHTQKAVGVNFNRLSNLDCAWLAELFCVDPIQKEVWACEDDKSLGLDGFNLVFFKTCWNIIKGGLVVFIKEFHSNAILPKASTVSFLTLIPKVEGPIEVSDFRPICLVSRLYKIVAEILASKLKRGIPSLISRNQFAFVQER